MYSYSWGKEELATASQFSSSYPEGTYPSVEKVLIAYDRTRSAKEGLEKRVPMRNRWNLGLSPPPSISPYRCLSASRERDDGQAERRKSSSIVDMMNDRKRDFQR